MRNMTWALRRPVAGGDWALPLRRFLLDENLRRFYRLSRDAKWTRKTAGGFTKNAATSSSNFRLTRTISRRCNWIAGAQNSLDQLIFIGFPVLVGLMSHFVMSDFFEMTFWLWKFLNILESSSSSNDWSSILPVLRFCNRGLLFFEKV